MLLIVAGIEAGADPRNGRHDRAGWAGRVRAAAATAQIAVNRTIAPIVTRARIARIIAWVFGADARDGQEREGGDPEHGGANAGHHTATGRLPRGMP